MQRATEQQTRELLSRAYSRGVERVLPKLRLVAIFDYHKAHCKLALQDYWDKMHSDVRKDAESVPSIKRMLDAGVEEHKALQTGALQECVVSKAVADALGATKMTPLRGGYSPLCLPVSYEIVEALEGKVVRFAYTNDDENFLVAQCGGSASGDLFVYDAGVEYNFEVKEAGAKAGEHDFKYDDEQNLTPNSQFPPHAKGLLDECRKLDLWDYIGKNYKFPEESARKAFEGYLRANNVSVYATTDLEGNIALVSVADLERLHAISYAGSEMRMAGRNPAKVFAPKYRDRILHDVQALVSADGTVIVAQNKMEPVKARGKDEITRLKLNPSFFVRVKKCREEDGNFVFKLCDIEQLKPSVSPHISFVGNADEVSEYYKEKRYEDEPPECAEDAGAGDAVTVEEAEEAHSEDSTKSADANIEADAALVIETAEAMLQEMDAMREKLVALVEHFKERHSR